MRQFLVRIGLFSMCFFGGVIEAATMHCVITGDTVAGDVGNSVLQDILEMNIFFKKIAKGLDAEASIKIIKGTDLSIGSLYKALYAIPSTSEDIIVFFYTGHGFHFGKDQDPWPQFYFSYPNEAVSFADVKSVLKKKPYKTLLMLTDCCNTYLKSPKIFSKKGIFAKRSVFSENEKKFINNLFFKKKKVVCATGAKVGTPAYCTQIGSFFAQSFIRAFKYEIRKGENSSWERIFSRTVSYTKNLESKQDPYYEINY